MEYEQIKKIIESCHLNFLIGSGASKPFLGTLGNIEQLLTDLEQKEDSDKKKIVEASIKKHYFDVAIKGNLDIESGSGSNLDETKNNYKDFVIAIDTIINKRKTNLVSKQVNIFTTNMDLFLEYTLENEKIEFNDGFSGRLNPIFGTENFHNVIKKTSTHYEYQSEVPLFNILKLHGSVNWKLNKDKINFDYGLEILKEIDSINSDGIEFLDIEKEVEGKKKPKTIKELFEEAEGKENKHEDFLSAYNKLLMINPTKQKFETTTRDLTFYELLRMYSNHLEKENSILFVFGFSFADEHIREITSRVAKSNPTLLIIIFAYDEIAIDKSIEETQNIKIIKGVKDDELTLEKINNRYFKKLSEELSDEFLGIKKEKKNN
jgi:hypothetical protein